MKRNLLGLFAVVLAIAVSSFTTPKLTYEYMIYGGTGIEKDMTNFSQTSTLPSHGYTALSQQKLNWFRVEDINDDGVSVAEFETSFEVYDVANDGADQLKDESADISSQLDLQNKP